MADRIDVEVRDRIDGSIFTKLQAIAVMSLEAHNNIVKLNSALRGGNVGAYATAANAAATATQNLSTAQKSAAITSGMVSQSLLGLIRQLRTLASVTLILGAGRALAGSVDAYTQLQNRIRNVLEPGQDLNRLTKEIFDSANRARVPVSDLAKSFQRFTLAIKEQGGSQAEALKVAETASKILTLQGATTNEAASALLQLSQAFNKGKLDGDEFRTVMELMPKAAQKIADVMGVTKGALLELAPTGAITIDVMRKAFEQLADEVNREFGDTTQTVAQSLTVLGNKIIEVFGPQLVSVVKVVTQVIGFLGDNLQLVAEVLLLVSSRFVFAFGAKAITAVKGIGLELIRLSKINPFKAMLSGLAGFLSGMKKAAIAVATFALTNPFSAILVVLTAVGAAIFLLRDQIFLTQDKFVTLGDVIRAVWEGIGDIVKIAWQHIQEVVAAMSFGDLGVSVGGMLRTITNNIISLLNTVVGKITGLVLFLGSVDWGDIWSALVFKGQQAWFELQLVFLHGLRLIAGIVQDMVNTVLQGIEDAVNGIRAVFFGEAIDIFSNIDLVGQVDDELKGLRDKFLEEHKEGAAAAQRVGETYAQSMATGFTIVDGLFTKIIDNIWQKAQTFAQQRRFAMPVPKLQVPDMGAAGADLAALNRVQLTTAQIAAEIRKLTTEFQTGKLEADDYWKKVQALAMTGPQAAANLQALGTAVNNFTTDLENGKVTLEEYIKVLDFLKSSGGLLAKPGEAGTQFLDDLRKKTQQATQATTDLGNKGADSFDKMRGSAEQYVNFFEQAVTKTFEHATDAIVEFAKTGKLNIKEMAASIAQDMLRLATNQFFGQLLQGLFKGGGGGFGGSLFGGGGSMFGGGGFASGGFTGNHPTNRIAGVVHGREFVMPAAATARHRPALEAMRAGRNAGGVNISIENYTSSKFEVKRISETDVRIIATEMAEKVVQDRTPRLMAANLRSANSRESKALNQTTNVRRRRN